MPRIGRDVPRAQGRGGRGGRDGAGVERGERLAPVSSCVGIGLASVTVSVTLARS